MAKKKAKKKVSKEKQLEERVEMLEGRLEAQQALEEAEEQAYAEAAQAQGDSDRAGNCVVVIFVILIGATMGWFLMNYLGGSYFYVPTGTDNSSQSSSGGSNARGGCPVGTCWSNGVCCASFEKYWCGAVNDCFSSRDEAIRVSGGQCLSWKISC